MTLHSSAEPETGPSQGSLGEAAALAQALASRICHDLVSPVGAIGNGVDLLRELGDIPGTEEIAMIGQSAARASDLLGFHRLAFGAAGADSAPLARSAVRRLLAPLMESPRVGFDFTGEEGRALPRLEARALALAALCARRLVPLSGTLRIALSPEGAAGATLTATGADPERRGEALALLAATIRAADPNPTTADPREIEYLLAAPAAAAAGLALDLELGAGEARLRFLPG